LQQSTPHKGTLAFMEHGRDERCLLEDATATARFEQGQNVSHIGATCEIEARVRAVQL
jgi:hypothetical protein